jgi:hypothetical protein
MPDDKPVRSSSHAGQQARTMRAPAERTLARENHDAAEGRLDIPLISAHGAVQFKARLVKCVVYGRISSSEGRGTVTAT